MTPDDGAPGRWRYEPLSVRHAPALLGPMQDRELYAYIPDHYPADLAMLEWRFGQWERGSPRLGEVWLNWVMFEGETPVATLQATVWGERATIGYVVLRAHWGRGVGAAGVRWLLRELREAHGVTLVRAFVDRRNERSARLLRSAGMTQLTELPDDTPETDFAFELRCEPSGLASPGQG